MSEEQESAYNPFRRPKFAALERLVCSYLIESLNAPPLEAITFICRAAQLLTQSEVERLNLDMESINSIYTVAQRLNSATPDKGGNNTNPKHHVFLGTLDFENDIRVWCKAKYYPHYIKYDEEIDIKTLPIEEAFHLTNQNLTTAGYNLLVSDFLQFATPFAQQLGGVLTELISPETYSDMLRVYKGSRDD